MPRTRPKQRAMSTAPYSCSDLPSVENDLQGASGKNLRVLCYALRHVSRYYLDPLGYRTIGDYVRERGKQLGIRIAPTYAIRYVQWASVYDDLDQLYMSTNPWSCDQLRQLVVLNKSDRKKVWESVLEQSKKVEGNKHFSYVDAIKNEAKTLARRTLRFNGNKTVGVFTSSTTDRWFTPVNLLLIIAGILGGDIDLDPFSEAAANEHVKARTFYTHQDNGYILHWFGRVFANPPGGTSEGRSCNGMCLFKAMMEYASGRVSECVLLLKAAIGYKWFIKVYSLPHCFLYRRPAFHNPMDPEICTASPHGYCLVYMGCNVTRFLEHAQTVGQAYSAGHETNVCLIEGCEMDETLLEEESEED